MVLVTVRIGCAGSASLKQAKLGTFTVKIRVTIAVPTARDGGAHRGRVGLARRPQVQGGFFCAARVRDVAADGPGGESDLLATAGMPDYVTVTATQRGWARL